MQSIYEIEFREMLASLKLIISDFGIVGDLIVADVYPKAFSKATDDEYEAMICVRNIGNSLKKVVTYFNLVPLGQFFQIHNFQDNRLFIQKFYSEAEQNVNQLLVAMKELKETFMETDFLPELVLPHFERELFNVIGESKKVNFFANRIKEHPEVPDSMLDYLRKMC